MKLELEPKEIIQIRQGLGKLPFDEIASLIVKIEMQVKEQTKQEEVQKCQVQQ